MFLCFFILVPSVSLIYSFQKVFIKITLTQAAGHGMTIICFSAVKDRDL
jgi:hypothetical protein